MLTKVPKGFPTMVLETEIFIEKREPEFTSFERNYLKWIICLNVKSKTKNTSVKKYMRKSTLQF
jgi:hypothetical protein